MRQLKITKQITSREVASLEKYLTDIGREALLSADEEAILVKQIRQGNKQAIDQLVRANLRFVVSVSKQYQNQGLTLPDLINEGNIGLIKAAERFDETRGFKFISYAVWWIRQSILHALSEQSRIVRLPLNKIGSINKINKAYVNLEQQYERAPTADELAEHMDLNVQEIQTSLNQNARHVSMDTNINENEENSSSLYDILIDDLLPSPDNKLEKESLQKDLNRLLSILSNKEREVMDLYYGLNNNTARSLDEIGEQLELTRERIRQIRDRALRKLRHTSKANMLRPHLG